MSAAFLLLLACLACVHAEATADTVHVEAKLLAVERAPGCGLALFGSPGTYLILGGPQEMVGKQIDLLIPCIQIPRRRYHANAGDLGSFEVGDVHELNISRINSDHVEVPQGVPGKTWYVIAASMDRQAPAPVGDAATIARFARAQIGVTVHYDPTYARIAYPMGDVPMERGVCADVLVRAFRAAGIDLQRLVHEDMAAHFAAYPHAWGLHRPDSNIDHRRVPNLETFFRRKGMALPVTAVASDYLVGDIVSWRLPNGLAHIGIVSDRMAIGGAGRPTMLHNIGAGTQEEDVLFAWKIVGHFRWPFAAATTHASH